MALDFRNGDMDLGSLEDRDADPKGFLNRLWQIPTISKCVGFKITRGQAEPMLEELLHDSRIKKIVLRRRNRLKTLVSELVAQKTDQWELYCQREKLDPPRVRVELNQLLNHVAENNAFYDKIVHTLSVSTQPYISVEYELLHSKLEQKKILDFLSLKLSYRQLAPASVKQTSTDLRAVISNFSELDLALTGTEFQHELHDIGY